MLTEDLRDHEHSLCVRDLNGTVPQAFNACFSAASEPISRDFTWF